MCSRGSAKVQGVLADDLPIPLAVGAPEIDHADLIHCSKVVEGLEADGHYVDGPAGGQIDRMLHECCGREDRDRLFSREGSVEKNVGDRILQAHR